MPVASPAQSAQTAPIRLLTEEDVVLYRGVRDALDVAVQRANLYCAASAASASIAAVAAAFILADPIARAFSAAGAVTLAHGLWACWRARQSAASRAQRANAPDLRPLTPTRAQLLAEAARTDPAVREYLMGWLASGRGGTLFEEDFRRCVTAREAASSPALVPDNVASDAFATATASGAARAHSPRALRGAVR